MIGFLAGSVLVALLYFSTGIRPAAACTPPEDYNPVKASDLIVRGRITDWAYTSDPYKQRGPPERPSDVIVTVKVTLHVDEVLKGDAPKMLTYTDRTRIVAYGDVVEYPSISSCEEGFIGEACEGKYAIAGFDDDRGPLRPEAFFFLGEGASDPEFDVALNRIDELGENDFPYLPVKLFYLVGVGLGVSAIVVAANVLRKRLRMAG
jgi:hypothetical protein